MSYFNSFRPSVDARFQTKSRPSCALVDLSGSESRNKIFFCFFNLLGLFDICIMDSLKHCALPGCMRPVWIENDGSAHDFCGKTHAVAYVLNHLYFIIPVRKSLHSVPITLCACGVQIPTAVLRALLLHMLMPRIVRSLVKWSCICLSALYIIIFSCNPTNTMRERGGECRKIKIPSSHTFRCCTTMFAQCKDNRKNSSREQRSGNVCTWCVE